MVGFAVVGLGMGKNRSRMIQETEGAELKLVVDVDEPLAKGFSEEIGVPYATNVEDALGRDDVDVVLVMTPSGTHVEVGLQVAAAGKHVITTKPMDVSTEACDRLIDACEKAGVLCGVDYQSRYVDTNYRVAEALKRGWLGQPLLGEVRFKWLRTDDYFKHGTGWRGTWAMDGGGSLANQGAHLLDVLSWFMGDPVRVYGEFAVMNHAIETEDVGLAILNFESGAKGTVVGTTTFQQNAYFSAEVHGTEGGVLITDVLNGEAKVYGDGLEAKLNTIENDTKSIVEDVIAAVEHGRPLRVDGREGRRTVALLEAIYTSGRQGAPIEFKGAHAATA